jgi:hypothetical protein
MRQRSAAQSHAINPATSGGHPAMLAGVEEVEVVVAQLGAPARGPLRNRSIRGSQAARKATLGRVSLH